MNRYIIENCVEYYIIHVVDITGHIVDDWYFYNEEEAKAFIEFAKEYGIPEGDDECIN